MGEAKTRTLKKYGNSGTITKQSATPSQINTNLHARGLFTSTSVTQYNIYGFQQPSQKLTRHTKGKKSN